MTFATFAKTAGPTAEFDVIFFYIDARHAFAHPNFADMSRRMTDWTRGACAGIATVESVQLEAAQILTFEPRVAALVLERLQSLGYRIGRRDLRPHSRGKVVEAGWLARQTGEDQQFLRALEANRRGRILTPGRAEHARLIALVAEALARTFISVAVASRDEARDFHDRLGRNLTEPIGLHLDGNTRAYERVTVGSLASVVPHHDQIVSFLDGAQGLTVGGEDALLAAGESRCYGFFHPAERFSSRSRGRLDLAFGATPYESPPRDGRRAAVQVVRAAVMSGATTSDGLTAVERKRRQIWADGARNRLIATIADAVAMREVQTLGRGVIAPAQARALVGAGPGARRVGVLVEVPEHARRLRGLLPDWDIRQGRHVDGDLTDSATGPSLDRTIATLVRVHAQRSLDLDVVIRTDGGRGGLELRGFPDLQLDSPGGEAFIVDLDDRIDSRGPRRARPALNVRGAGLVDRRRLTPQPRFGFRCP
ncbi:MAG: hypothetical protein JWN86_1826 [Planctomycetota bacterium]|nr:hypothetical protein [Planctomycetota bacterium]